ncbi:YUH1 [Candida oxycetoniae]|uniref:Ubiquitin carboxyl-terminal hydrolase n=1 Tax=Candida oxycetoniae TaxID=497107 RepID=A0AAI9SYQ0_9ASCO|nr:YUH1 [Candida oxycetoniae]KAI3405442.2 YUH1 [Candida oxycetoniae]
MPDSTSVIPLESNPQIFTDLAHKLGVSPILQFHDVYSLTDPDLLAFLPHPIFGVILLFPITPANEANRIEADQRTEPYLNDNSKIHWFKQTIRNGCGLYALLHILTNLPPDLNISNSKISDLVTKLNTKNKSIGETSLLIEELERGIQLDENYGSRGQTEAPNATDDINLHFISFIKGRDNHLYELDGRRNGPVDLGEVGDSGKENLIHEPKLVEKIQSYIDNTDEENRHNFAVMAIGPTLD